MRFNRKTIITVIIFALAAIIIGGGYIWYSNNYGNMKKLTIRDNSTLDYDWKSTASDAGITVDYLWSRTKELMLDGASDGTLIPSNLMIEGRLVSEPQEESGVYRLSDQALLLTMYVRRNDRFASENLVRAVNDSFSFEEESNYEKEAWLMAYLEYYASYGKSSDYGFIEEMTSQIFDENGQLRLENLRVASYNENPYQSLVEVDENAELDATLQSDIGESSDSYYEFQGVVLSSINLPLIQVLETNNLLPEGSYESNLNLVLNGVVSDSISLFAYAYEILDDGTISYVNSNRVAAAIDVPESVLTMRNLSEIGELPSNSYLWLKSNVINNSVLRDTYYFVTGNTEGNEAIDSYVDILNIAINEEDFDLFSIVCSRIGGRVATYNNSPALSMIYRPYEDRYVFYARENLEVAIALL